jgi:hypothetical protein
MKKLFALINPKGKTKNQLVDELWQAYKKYESAEKKAEEDLEVDVTEQEQGTAYQIIGLPKPEEKDEK